MVESELCRCSEELFADSVPEPLWFLHRIMSVLIPRGVKGHKHFGGVRLCPMGAEVSLHLLMTRAADGEIPKLKIILKL